MQIFSCTTAFTTPISPTFCPSYAPYSILLNSIYRAVGTSQMDPLSVIASVSGIATAGGEVIKILGPYTTAAKDAPKIAAEISSEVLATQTILSGLEQLVNNLSTTNIRYASLIQVDQLTAVLLDGVKIFSELLEVLQTLPPLEPTSPGGSLWSPIQWVRKKSSLTAIVTRLQAFKSSIVCILCILQSDSQARAEENQQQLISAVEILLESNPDLSRRIMGMESTIDTMSQRRATIQFIAGIDDLERPSTSLQRVSLFEFEFERDLKSSRVYRKAKRDTMDFSARSSVARTHAWSSLSGISLSDISHISVLALPLYAEDISNPHHYDFGHKTFRSKPLPSPTLHTRSIYHECVEVQLQLSQLEWFTEFQQNTCQRDSEEESPLSALIAIFRHGTPLLMLFNQLDGSRSDRWKDLMSLSPSSKVAKMAIIEFNQACLSCLNLTPYDCFTVDDLLSNDTTNHVQVIVLVRLLLARLTKTGAIQAVVFESTPNIFTAEPNPAGLAVDSFLCDERLYLKCLESLLQTAEQIRFFDIFPADTFEQLVAPVGPLVDVQRKFLIRAEMLVSKPYLCQIWQAVFQEWSQQSSTYYVALITAEAESKLMIRTTLSSLGDHDNHRRTLLNDVLAKLGLPSQQLDKYEAFLKELSEYGLHGPDDIKSATESLELVKEAVEASIITQKLSRARAALSKDLDYESNKVVWGLGKLLMFDKVDIVYSGGGPPTKAQLYLFQKGLLQATESYPNNPRRDMLRYGRLSPRERIKPQVPIIRIIHAKDVQKVLLSSRKELNGCEIEWMAGGKENSLFFALSSKVQIDKWKNKVEQVQRENGLIFPSQSSLREYFLVLVGGSGCGKNTLAIQFTQPYYWYLVNPFVEDTDHRPCIIDNEFALVNVIDTTGLGAFPGVRERCMKDGEGFMLVYSVTSRQSFEEVTEYQQQILNQKDKDYFPMILVGNDCSRESERDVSTQEGEALARAFGCMFIEVDAKSRVNVDEAFFDLVREVRRYRRKMAVFRWGTRVF
ncbi:Ras family other [Fusarium beomiforme]|uniref:Ras family other n=1 Tax=Fusarium beomiforme TaxID=44412 RepID=A0A9P5AZM2_9HYPO|nr:Ras family other [Fusarium beomiforme]